MFRSFQTSRADPHTIVGKSRPKYASVVFLDHSEQASASQPSVSNHVRRLANMRVMMEYSVDVAGFDEVVSLQGEHGEEDEAKMASSKVSLFSLVLVFQNFVNRFLIVLFGCDTLEHIGSCVDLQQSHQ